MTDTTKGKKLPALGVILIMASMILVIQYNKYIGTVYQHYKTKVVRLPLSLGNFLWQANDTAEKEQQRRLTAPFKPLPGTEFKTILFWTPWFGVDWFYRFGPHTPEGLRASGCPIWQCNFTSNRSALLTADAVIIESMQFGGIKSQIYERPEYQRWIWVIVEAPGARKPNNITKENIKWNPSFLINWTMTHHSNADIVAFYGHFTAINATQMPVTPNMMSSFPETLQKYEEGIASGITLSDIMGSDWQQKLNKTKIVAWMSGHCPTNSRREVYIQELSKHIEIDTYGWCGKKRCGSKGVFIDDCWIETLGRYSFYMAMENSICIDYITEKLYLPIINYNVPVVWGGSNYSRYLPPGSFIDARQYHPKDLAKLLTDLHNNPEEYSKYHLWRGYWQVHRGGTFCQLCHRLHTDTEPKHYYDLNNWRLNNGKCINAPKDMFNKTQRPEFWQKFLEDHNSTML